MLRGSAVKNDGLIVSARCEKVDIRMNAPIEILLVEDDPGNVKLILLALDECRLADRVQIVRDGVEALDFLTAGGAFGDRDIEELPRMILLDLKLPKMSGIELLRHLKSDERLHRIPVVAFTSSSDERDMIATYDLGINSYIVKPIELQQFSDSVKQVAMYWLRLNQQPQQY